ncbi:MAG: hypothetical protein ABSF29_13345 [Tepidisphaeraceae bacterium]|jgi:hypothetical protein
MDDTLPVNENLRLNSQKSKKFLPLIVQKRTMRPSAGGYSVARARSHADNMWRRLFGLLKEAL